MKKILFTLLLLPMMCMSQMTITVKASGSSTSGVGSTSSTTYTAGRLYLLISGTSNTSAPATINPTGTGLTFTNIANVLSTTNTLRIQCFRFAPTATTTTGISYTYTGTQTGGFVVIYEITGAAVGNNGADGIAQVVTDAQVGANPSLTLATFGEFGRGAVAGFINNANPFGGTAETNWSGHPLGYNTPATGSYSVSRAMTNDNTVVVTAASSTWAGFAVEIKSARRTMVQ